jgi:3-oxoacyl-[acyl-carrier protein] reductase
VSEAGRRALVLGGSGHLGREVVRALSAEGVPTVFTFHRRKDVAEALERETGALSLPVDLADPTSIRALFERLAREGHVPDALAHCAVAGDAPKLEEITDATWDHVHAVNVRSALVAVQAFARGLEGRSADVVFSAALDGITHVPSSAAFAASQAALVGLARALAKELGPRDIRVNVAVLGPLGGGLSASLPPSRLADYKKFSALQREGTAVEAARAIVRLLLGNRWMTGSILPITGGL